MASYSPFAYISIMKAIKAVLFDHDDTLVGTIKPKWEQHKYIAKTFYNKELRDDEIRLHWGKPLTVLLKLLYETEDIEGAMAHNLSTRHFFPKLLPDDTIETLESLHKMGKILGLITATARFSLENDLKTLGIPKSLFDYIQTEDDTNVHKPDPAVFNPIKEKLLQSNIHPHEVVYVGDGLHDMKAAKGAGFNFIGIGTGLVTPEEFQSHQVVGIHSLKELLSL